MIRPMRWPVLDRAFGDFIAMYQTSAFDQYRELRDAYPEPGAPRFDDVLDRYVVPQLQGWPAEAQSLLANALGIALVAFRDALAGNLIEVWEDSNAVDGFYGHVRRRLFEGRGWSLSDFDDDPTVYAADLTPLDELLPDGVDVPPMRWPFVPDRTCRVYFDAAQLFVAATGRFGALIDHRRLSADVDDSELGGVVREQLTDGSLLYDHPSSQSRETARQTWTPLADTFGVEGRSAGIPMVHATWSERWFRFAPAVPVRYHLVTEIGPGATDAEIGQGVRVAIQQHPDLRTD